METLIPDLPDDIDVTQADLHQHGPYWCVVVKRDGQWSGYVGSSGKGNQRTKYTAFTIFRPVCRNAIVGVLFEYLTNPYLFQNLSRRMYKFVLATLKHLLEASGNTVWNLTYRNHPAILRLKGDRRISLEVMDNCSVSLNIEDWTPTILNRKVFPYTKSIKE